MKKTRGLKKHPTCLTEPLRFAEVIFQYIYEKMNVRIFSNDIHLLSEK